MCNALISCLVHVQILNLYFLDFNSFQGSRGSNTRLQTEECHCDTTVLLTGHEVF